MDDPEKRPDDEIVTTWLAYQLWSDDRPHRENLGDTEEEEESILREQHGWWALEAVWEVARTDPERLWRLILRIVEQADDVSLCDIAAGPLEQLLCAHPYQFIDRVEAAAMADPRFRLCLSGVWGWYTIPDEVQKRMRRTWGG